MKKRISLFLVILFLHISFVCGQSTFTVGCFNCEILKDSTVRISRTPIPYNMSGTLDSLLRIPSTVEHKGKIYSVRDIAEKGFAGNADIRHLVIDEGIKQIRREAFICCVNLQSVRIPESVTHIEENIFGSCYNMQSIIVDSANKDFDSRDNCNAIIETANNVLIAGCDASKIPFGVTTIGSEAFAHCKKMKSITLPEGITHISNLAFSGCSNLKNISLPQSLEYIGMYAFYGCNSLSSIVIPKNVQKIEWGGLFRECNQLKSLIVETGNSVYDSRQGCNAIIETCCDKLVTACAGTKLIEGINEIGEEAFSGVPLCRLHIPKSVTKINCLAFTDSNCLMSITVDEENPFYASPLGSNAILTKDAKTLVLGCGNTIIPKEVTEIGAYAFGWNNAPVQSLCLPEGLKSIGESAFSRCGNLWQIYIPSSVESIGENAFYGCPNLTVVQLRGKVKELKSSVFSDCKKLAVVELPEGMTTIGDRAFSHCTNLYSISVPSSLREIKHGAFERCPCEKDVLQVVQKKAK